MYTNTTLFYHSNTNTATHQIVFRLSVRNQDNDDNDNVMFSKSDQYCIVTLRITILQYESS